MKSIRLRLLVSLLALWTTVCAAFALVALERSQHEVEELLDAELAQTARMLRRIALAGRLSEVQKAVSQSMTPIGHPYETKISFQLWDGDHLVGMFGAAPTDRLAQEEGYADREIGATKWRVFGLPSPDGNHDLYVAQDYSIRQELVHYLTMHALQPILWSLPVVVLLIGVAVSDGLKPLVGLARAVKGRSARRLDPIDEAGVPVEIRPVISALNSLMEQLRQTLAAERRFAADASHELRTPLAVIRTHAQIARRSRDGDERNEALDNVALGVDHATRLVSQLLTLSRIGSQNADEEAVPTSVALTVPQIVENKRDGAIAKSIDLRCELDADDSFLVNLPAPALAVLVGNLVDNAVKYTPPGGRVDVSARRGNGRVLLTVTDSGPGIAAGERDRVFDRFYRPAGQSEPGAGLGLSIVRHICDVYDALIELGPAREAADRDGPQGLRVRLSLHPAEPFAN